ncbi:MAG TPA: DUF4251 domain-containing protein [Prolixibacteraceae bacterium]|nr:DUF4251 domain-containing protein [Prolixibacteraceae bacterium]HPR60440.1 DUF4251 domain-containing protein [Prolixibacteraceae bacterium]
MRRFLFLLISILLTLGVCAQKNERKSRRALKAERESIVFAKIDSMIMAKDYNFVARSANPMQMQTVQLTSEYNLKVKSDSVFVFLPYYGRAYQADFSSTDGGIKLEGVMKAYTLDQKKSNYEIRFEAENRRDTYRFYLTIGKGGYASLTVNSNHRQTIIFNGIIAGLGL